MHASAAEFADELVIKFWEDAVCGRIFFASSDHPALEENEGWPGVFSSPAGRVGKTDPITREETGESRFLHDARDFNDGCLKERHPPALTPKHSQLARTVLWWHARYPSIPLYLSKRDIAAAFKRIYLAP